MTLRHLISSVFILLLSACSAQDIISNQLVSEANVTDTTVAGRILAALPAPQQQIAVSVYDFQDQTGQFRNNEQYAEYSSAVTKGGLSVLVKALLDTGSGKWFMVAERGALQDLLKERQIITAMRNDYVRADGTKLRGLPPIVYGGMLIEGGIVFYDSNVLTGGAAAGYFGITGSAQYHRDIVTVYLRAIDVSSGKVILAVNSSKTVFSYALSTGITRYLSYDRLLDMEAGFSVNEPSQLAVRQAIETGLYSLIMEGALKNIWTFANKEQGKKAIDDYLKRKNSTNAFNPPIYPGASSSPIAIHYPSMEMKSSANAKQERSLDTGLPPDNNQNTGVLNWLEKQL